MLSKVQAREVDAVLGEFCRREPLPHVRPELQYAVRIHGNVVTLVELRPTFRAEVGRSESPVARFRFIAKDRLWQLYYRDRGIRWHRYPPSKPAKRLATLFSEIRRDPSGIFWGVAGGYEDESDVRTGIYREAWTASQIAVG